MAEFIKQSFAPFGFRPTPHVKQSAGSHHHGHAPIRTDQAPSAPTAAPLPPQAPVAPVGDAFELDPRLGHAPDALAPAVALQIGAPVLPDPDCKAQQASRASAAGVVLDGLAYRQRHLAEAIHWLTRLASDRMEAVGRSKVAYGKSQATAALQAAELELKTVGKERLAMWTSTASRLIDKVGDLYGPVGRLGGGVLGQAASILDKTYGPQRHVDDAKWQKSYLALRERINKQLEDQQSGEYDKSIRLLERTLETTRQMATGNTDTLKSISNNL